MDATLVLIDSDVELARAPSSIDYGIHKTRPISHGSKRRHVL
jgi:hypothetical protein